MIELNNNFIKSDDIKPAINEHVSKTELLNCLREMNLMMFDDTLKSADIITVKAIEQAIITGSVKTFGELEYCVFRYCEQFS